MLHTPLQLTQYALMLAACAYAVWKGGLTERVAAADIFIGWTLTPLLTSHDWSAAQYPILGVDSLYFAVLLALALTSDRFWPMAAAAFALLPVLVQLAYIANAHIWPWTFFYVGGACDLLVLAILALGVWLEVARPLAGSVGDARGA